MRIDLNPTLLRIVDQIRAIGGRVFLVGGSVRDYLMNGNAGDDIDIEVFNVSGKTLHTILSTFGSVTIAGKFSIYTVNIGGMKYDFSLPRRDNKIGRGYTQFDFEIDPYMRLEEAAARRDFTINSMMVELPDMFLYDFFGGRKDLKSKLLRATSDHFTEDPLRAMRGFQFIARFGFTYEFETAHKVSSLLSEADTLVPDQLRKQWKNWALGAHSDLALREMLVTGWTKAFPELHAMSGVPQDPEWHPEGDVFSHTYYVLQAMQRIIERSGIVDEDRIQVLKFAALLHDVGKPATTFQNQYHRWSSPGHAEAGVGPARAFLERAGVPNKIKNQVLPLVREHMSHVPFFDTEPTARSVRRLAIRLGDATIEDLALLVEADHSGRPPLKAELPSAMRDILELSRELQVSLTLPKPILLGRHLIELGLTPSPQFGTMLSEAYEAQLSGVFTDVEGGKTWVSGKL